MTLQLLNLLKNKYWLVNSLFYFALASLIVVVFSYLIFTFKVYLQSQKINEMDKIIAAYGTDEQRSYEKKVFDYKRKIDDFAVILKNHKISSNIFIFIEERTLPKIWFSQFETLDLSEPESEINLSGEAENTEVLSRQIQVLEKSKDYIKSVSIASYQVGPAREVKFVLNLSLEPKIFNYVNSSLPVSTNTTESPISNQ